MSAPVEERELRRVNAGSTYWIRRDVRGRWSVTADGVIIAGPYDDYAQALAGLDAVAPEVK